MHGDNVRGGEHGGGAEGAIAPPLFTMFNRLLAINK